MPKKITLNLMMTLLMLFFPLIAGTGSQTVTKDVDVLLLIDGSGSMGWPGRDPENLRLQGAKLFIDLCENSDRIGVIDFSSGSKAIFPLSKIATSQNKKLLKDRIESIKVKGEFTDITLALQTAIEFMKLARPEAWKAVVLLTDGEIDPDPRRDIFSPYNKDYLKEIQTSSGSRRKISEDRKRYYKEMVAPISKEILSDSILPYYKEIKIPIFTVAFGEAADTSLLREIADSTVTEDGMRNYYRIHKAYELQPVFSEIIEQLKKTRSKVGEEKVNFLGDEIVHQIHIDDLIKEVTFKFIFAQKVTSSDVSISLKDPSGNIIDKTTAKQGMGHISEAGYELYNIFNPEPGTWEAIIKGRKDVKLDITVSTWGRTDLKILTGGLKSEYFTGDSIPVMASLEIEGKRVTSRDFLSNLSLESQITTPNNVVESLELYDDGYHADSSANDGVYGSLFTHTSAPGDYIVKIIAQGKTTEGRRLDFIRETEYRVRVLERRPLVALAKDTSRKEAQKPIKKTEEIKGKGWLKTLLIVLILAVVVGVVAIIIVKRKTAGQEGLPEGDLVEPPIIMPAITLKIKDGKTVIAGSKIADPSVGEKNLIILRTGDQFFIHAEEGSLELNGKQVSEEKEVRDGDIVKIGELYFEIQLKPQQNRITFLGINKEEATSKIKEE